MYLEWVRGQLDEYVDSHLCGGTLHISLPTRVLNLGDDGTHTSVLLSQWKG